MCHSFDRNRMVGEDEPTSARQRRRRRAQLGESGYRIYTQDLMQVAHFSLQVCGKLDGSLFSNICVSPSPINVLFQFQQICFMSVV